MLLAVASEHCRSTDVANRAPVAVLITLFETKDIPQRLFRVEVGIKDAQLHEDREEKR